MIIESKPYQRQAIAWMLLNGTYLDIPECHFRSDAIREMYRGLKQQFYSAGSIQIATLPETLVSKICEHIDYDSVDFPRNPEIITAALEREYRRYAAWEAAHGLIKRLEDDDLNHDEEILGHAEKIYGVMRDAKTAEYDHAGSVAQFLENIDDRRKHPGELKGIPGGLKKLDYMIRGWQHGKTYVVGGLKKTGKSRFVLNMVSRWIFAGRRGIVFSMEMTEGDIHTCILGNNLGINTASIGTSELSDADYDRIEAKAREYDKTGLKINRKSSISPVDVKNAILKTKNNTGVDFVVVDYIQRMKGDGERRVAQIENCMTRLADMARDENVIMIILSQLSGSAEHKSDSPVYAFIKESQAIIEACDCALMLFDENRGKEKAPTGHEIKCTVLQRDGVSDYTIPFWAQLQYSRFTDVEENQNDNEDWTAKY